MDKLQVSVGHGGGSSGPGAGLQSGTSVFSLGFGMIQVAIGTDTLTNFIRGLYTRD
jgi:hypothetical protein